MIENMSFNLEERALSLSEKRASLLASNIANSATPHYLAKDFDFSSALKSALNSAQSHLKTTDKNHISTEQGGVQVGYRIPMQFSHNGNTTDTELDRKNFIENAIKYQASLSLAQNKLETLMKAIRGE